MAQFYDRRPTPIERVNVDDSRTLIVDLPDLLLGGFRVDFHGFGPQKHVFGSENYVFKQVTSIRDFCSSSYLNTFKANGSK